MPISQMSISVAKALHSVAVTEPMLLCSGRRGRRQKARQIQRWTELF